MSRTVFGLFVVACLLTACNDSQLAGVPPQPDAPVAVISSASSSYATLETASLDGSQSYDPDNDAPDAIVEYRWSMVSVPPGSASTITGSGASASVFVDIAGSYTVQLIVVDQDGLESEPEQFTLEGIPLEDIHVELSWDIDVADVDVHMIAPGGALFDDTLDCFFANCVPGTGGALDWGPAGPTGDPTLDLDEVDGYGPENINIQAPVDGNTYRVSVHYWSDDGLGATTATVRVYLSGELHYEAAQQLTATGKTWDVVDIEWPTGTITPLGNVYDCDPLDVSFGGTC